MRRRIDTIVAIAGHGFSVWLWLYSKPGWERMAKRSRILVTNDDGIGSGLVLPFIQAMRTVFDVVAIIPRDDCSLTGHSASVGSNQRLQLIGEDCFVLDGFPADCVALGLNLPEFGTFDAVAAGVNRGLNIGSDTWYSGTVAAAREAALAGLAGIAISCAEPGANPEELARIATGLVKDVMERSIAGKGVLVNINIPASGETGLKGIAQTLPADHGSRSIFSLEKVHAKEWRVSVVAERVASAACHDRCECTALDSGFVSVAVIQRFPCKPDPAREVDHV